MSRPIRLLCYLVLLLSPLAFLPADAEENPADEGFLAAQSDPSAVALADSVMARLGGRKAWDSTRYLSWRFFGRRFHLWDKDTGRIRVEWNDDAGRHHVVLTRTDQRTGRAWIDRVPVAEGGGLKDELEEAYAAWINDSYWVFMPYKLKDRGVRLQDRGGALMEDGRPARVLRLSFQEVGLTPENLYDVYVSTETGLVEQWAFYRSAEDEEPRFITPWHDWQRHGRILLSADRGEGRRHTDLKVLEEVPEGAFSNPAPLKLGPGL